ncbi:MAG: glutaminyl-peptide cyclotransferase [Gammaproteobacteria bacterium]|nr:glutaminyl-peptide cyclotransferase [Gammaproteobacteria bacterium]
MKRSRVERFTRVGLLACMVVAILGVYRARALPSCTTREGPQYRARVIWAPHCSYRVIAVWPHDPDAFTQGLVYDEGFLFEGTGLLGQSSLRRVSLQTGEVVQEHALSPEHFGEGITVFGDRIYQLTWQSHLGFVYDKTSFELLKTFEYPTEGWGLTHDGQRLIMSDGTATLRFIDPEALTEAGRVTVFDGWTPVTHLNELEYINGFVYANVWPTDRIARIDPQTGYVTGWIDLSDLRALLPADAAVDVLNGIAYDALNDWLIVTGKLWPRVFVFEVGVR